MNLQNLFWKKLKNDGLITEYYAGTNFSLCRVADWSIMAILINPSNELDSEGDVVSSTYYAWHVDKEFTEKIIANNAVFDATLVSKETAREPDLCINTNTGEHMLLDIRNEVKQGIRNSLISDKFELFLKEQYNAITLSWIEAYGNPPVFSNKKMWIASLLFFLYPLGLPWFYVGQYWKGVLMFLGILLAAFVGPLFPVVLIVEGISVIVFYIRLWGGRIKDKRDLPIYSKARKEMISSRIQRYNEYQKELGGKTA